MLNSQRLVKAKGRLKHYQNKSRDMPYAVRLLDGLVDMKAVTKKTSHLQLISKHQGLPRIRNPRIAISDHSFHMRFPKTAGTSKSSNLQLDFP